jgi:hypothetical protein
MKPILRSIQVLAFVALGACSASERSLPSNSADGGAGNGPQIDPTTGTPVAIVGKLRGRVLAPEGKIPVSGALVALWGKEPEAPTVGLHCDSCVALPREVPYVMTGADGTFELPVPQTGSFHFVVQKGGFRRVRSLDVVSGDQDVPAILTTLPGKSDPAKGDSIPKIAVVKGEWDPIERSLAKLGIGHLVADEVAPSSMPFDFYDDPSPNGAKSGTRLLSDPSLLAQYEIVMLPCAGASGTTCDDNRPSNPTIQSALKDFVEGGGRLYVTDYNYEFVRQLWPGTLTWSGESTSVGSACQKTSYDAPGVVDDPGLKSWLTAVGHSAVTLQKSWTTLDGVHEVQSIDPAGNPATIAPHVWMSAQKADGVHAATVSFERGCGRVLFSTYHTAGDAMSPLLPQEKALLYVLLETLVCVDVPIPK